MAKQPTRTTNFTQIAEPTPRWVAVRTKPGSQMPKRFFRTERVRSKKGYRLAPTVNPDLSAVENALGQAGFDCYMPAEQRLQKDRRRPFVWTPRRFALMVGYVFVRDPQDIDALERVPGVQSVVRDGVGRPLEISIQAIMDIRAVEAALEVEFAERSRAARQALRRRAKKNPTIEKIVQSLDIAGKLTVPFELEPVAA